MNLFEGISVSSASKSLAAEYDKTHILKYNIIYPVFSVQELKSSALRMNNYYNSNVKKFIMHCENELLPAAVCDYKNSIKNDFPVHEYEALSEYTITYNEKGFLSLYIDCYEYTGGAHGITVRCSDTWDVKKGCRISLKEVLFCNQINISEVKDEVIRQIELQEAENPNTYFENYEELVKNTFNPKQFYLTENGVTVYFQQYDIAPYVTGIPVFEIPFVN